MTYRHHLLIDSIVQALIIIFFSILLPRAPVMSNILQLMAILLFLWQFVNALVSYKFFERMSKKLFVRVAGYSLVFVIALRGITALAAMFAPFMKIANDLEAKTEPFILMFLPFLCAALALWYLYITLRDLYNLIFKTI